MSHNQYPTGAIYLYIDKLCEQIVEFGTSSGWEISRFKTGGEYTFTKNICEIEDTGEEKKTFKIELLLKMNHQDVATLECIQKEKSSSTIGDKLFDVTATEYEHVSHLYDDVKTSLSNLRSKINLLTTFLDEENDEIRADRKGRNTDDKKAV